MNMIVFIPISPPLNKPEWFAFFCSLFLSWYDYCPLLNSLLFFMFSSNQPPRRGSHFPPRGWLCSYFLSPNQANSGRVCPRGFMAPRLIISVVYFDPNWAVWFWSLLPLSEGDHSTPSPLVIFPRKRGPNGQSLVLRLNSGVFVIQR